MIFFSINNYFPSVDVTSPLGPGNVFKELGDTEKLISEQNLELQALLQELNCCNI